MKFKYFISVMLLVSSSSFADNNVVVPVNNSIGKYAFKFSADPTQVACFKVTRDFSKAFLSCNSNSNNSTTPASYKYQCVARKKQEYLVFDTLKQCKNTKSTMEDNGY